MIFNVNPGGPRQDAAPPGHGAEARGFEPRKGANPNRIRRPMAGMRAGSAWMCPRRPG
jgi:hypothetical protein